MRGIRLAALLVATWSAPVALAGEQDFTLHNKTGVEIHELYVSPHKSDEWGEDILGRDTLADGESLDITFDDREYSKKWDLKIVDEEDSSIEWEKLDLTKISEVTLRIKKGKAYADTK